MTGRRWSCDAEFVRFSPLLVPRVMCPTVLLRSASEARTRDFFPSGMGPRKAQRRSRNQERCGTYCSEQKKTKKGVSVLINVVLTLKTKKEEKKQNNRKHGSQTLWACWYTKLINRFNLVCSREKEKLRQKQIFSRKYITCKKKKKWKKNEAQTCW